MGSKVYLVVESDKSQCDPLSRMMKDLVVQLKTGAKCWKPPYLTNVEDRICVKIPEPKLVCVQQKDPCRPKSCCEPAGQVFYLKCEPKPSSCPPPCPPAPKCPRSASIAAEACIDAEGRANARIFVNGRKVVQCPPPICATECPQLSFCVTECPPPCPPKFCVTECPPPPSFCVTECSPSPTCCSLDQPKKPEYPWCKKRNGLDPTHAELRGMPKFEYLPYSCKIPEFRCCRAERTSAGSGSSINPRSRKYQENLAAMKNCAKNLTEARLVKYNTCTRMRNGMQDKCDPLVKRTLRSCCKPKKC